MIKTLKNIAAIVAVAGLMGSVWVTGADSETVVKDFMKKYHKAPKGTDNTAQKAQKGAATADEIKGLIAGYKAMTTTKPPQGDEASWKEKTSKVYAAAQALEKGGADAQGKYKEASNCKACHDVHRPK
jgi:ClpP class serine protease